MLYDGFLITSYIYRYWKPNSSIPSALPRLLHFPGKSRSTCSPNTPENWKRRPNLSGRSEAPDSILLTSGLFELLHFSLCHRSFLYRYLNIHHTRTNHIQYYIPPAQTNIKLKENNQRYVLFEHIVNEK